MGADDHVYPNFIDVMQWLADSNLLEMIVDKLSPSVSDCCIAKGIQKFIVSYTDTQKHKHTHVRDHTTRTELIVFI